MTTWYSRQIFFNWPSYERVRRIFEMLQCINFQHTYNKLMRMSHSNVSLLGELCVDSYKYLDPLWVYTFRLCVWKRDVTYLNYESCMHKFMISKYIQWSKIFNLALPFAFYRQHILMQTKCSLSIFEMDEWFRKTIHALLDIQKKLFVCAWLIIINHWLLVLRVFHLFPACYINRAYW